MKSRRHHNNTGYRQIQNGKTRDQVAHMAKRILGKKPRHNTANGGAGVVLAGYRDTPKEEEGTP